jgi:hypothetical protein
MQVAAFFEHSAYDMTLFRDRLLAYGANSYSIGGITITVWASKHFGQRVTLGGIDHRSYRFAFFKRRPTERAGARSLNLARIGFYAAFLCIFFTSLEHRKGKNADNYYEYDDNYRVDHGRYLCIDSTRAIFSWQVWG